ncbi:MAG: 50S ribosomal protein L15 [Nitrospinota bacterium]|nr:50S ribosomal protein L15 [Nitrospinota bacterium]
MLSLSNLHPAPNVRKNRKRVGRGRGSGTGKTCGKGQKGQNSRSGGGVHPWFEGGQMPLQRRLPKRGFTNIFKKHFEIVNLSRLASMKHEGPWTPEIMKEKGVIKKLGVVKILGNGELEGALTIHAHKFTKSALSKIEKSGGKAVVL